MAVLVDGVSVILRRPAVEVCLDAGLDSVRYLAPDMSVCWDDHLVQMQTRTTAMAAHLVTLLQPLGLIFQAGQQCVDVAVVDEHRGPTISAPWLHRFKSQDGVTFVALAGRDPEAAFVPVGWSRRQVPQRPPSTPVDVCGGVMDVRDDQGRSRCIYVCEWVKAVTTSWIDDDVRLELPQVPIAEARLALIAYLKDAPYASLEHLRDDLRAGRLTTQSLPLAVRWGLHYAGVTRHPSER